MHGGECSGVYHGDHDTSISPCVLGVVYGGGRHCAWNDQFTCSLVPFHQLFGLVLLQTKDIMIDYIYKDFQSHALRASLEVLGMLIGVGMSILLAITTPYPPMLYAYIGWLISAALLGLCSWHRGSFGLATTYACYLVIDGIGLARTLGVF